MTLEEYINNPEGKGASNTPYRGMYNQYYTQELDKLILKVNGKIEYHLYVNGDRYYILFKIPHHTYENFFYDVVFEFSTNNNSYKIARDLKKYDVKFFSNDPSFMFTWCYAYNKAGLLIPNLKKKAATEALTMAPKVRNPSESTGYDKYIYYGYLLIKLYNLFDKEEFKLNAKPYVGLSSSVMHAKDKYNERLKKEEEYKKMAKGKKDTLEKHANANTFDNSNKEQLISRTPIVGAVKPTRVEDRIHHTTRVVPSVKRSKKI